MKIIHTADLHLDSAMNTVLTKEKAEIRRYELIKNWLYILEYARDNDIKIILISGDLFDSEYVSETTGNVLRKSIEDYSEIKFFYLRGNHDAGNILSSMDKKPSNLYCFIDRWKSYRMGKICITANEKLEEDFPKFDRNYYNILMYHGNITKDFSTLRKLPIDYLALGHIHKYMEGSLDNGGMYINPGSPSVRGYDEEGDHGFSVLNIDPVNKALTHEYISIPGRRVENIEIEIDYSESDYDVCKKIEGSNLNKENYIRIILKGKIESGSQINIDYIYNTFKDSFFALKIKDETEIEPYVEEIEIKDDFKSVFRRIVMEEEISDEMKNEIIKMGEKALSGEKL